MEWMIPIGNTVILVFILFYQVHRNRSLAERLSEHNKLIQEIKAVVDQQASAISSQAHVVSSAIEYAKAFDIKKVEDILRRELNLEREKEKSQIRG